MMTTAEVDERVRHALAHGRPAIVKDVLVRSGSDWSGDPAVWLWLIVADEVTDPASPELDVAREWSTTAARAVAADRLVYVAFRKQSEQQEIGPHP